MLRRFRITLVWLLMMVVPAYGMAAVGALLCAPADGSVLQAVHADARPTPHGAQLASVRHGSAATQSPAAAYDDGHHGGQPAGHHASDKCSACAPCAAAVAPPSASVPMTRPAVAGADFPPLPAAVDEVVIAGLERPPRVFLA